MFSDRLPWNQSSNLLSECAERKRRSGVHLLDLTISNPTQAGILYPARALDPLSDPAGLLYQPDPRGLIGARQDVCAYYRELGIAITPEQVQLTAATSEAYSFLFQLLANPGDEILAPRPSYPLFDFLAGLSAVSIRQYPLRYDGSWHMDFETLAASVRERTRAIVVVNPNNPTGSFLSRAEWDRLQVFAAQRDLAIIVDEVFCDYPLSKAADRVQTTAGSSKALTFALSGLSKVAGLPQLKLGWIVASGPNAARALEGLEWIADTFLSVGTPVQLSLASLLRTGAAVRTQIAERTAANLHRLRETLHGSAANVLQVDGGWYGTIQVPRTRSEEQWVLRLLEERDVLVQPGYFFDFEAEAFLVVSLLTPLDTFADGVTRLRDLL